MSETQTAEVGGPRVGGTFGGVYRVIAPTSGLAGRKRWLIEHCEHGEPLILTCIGAPHKEAEADKIKRGFERTQRAASWVRHPGVVVPTEFLYEGGLIYSVSPAPSDVTMGAFIGENEPKLPHLVGWVIEVAGMLELLHESRQPQFLGRLPLENLRVKGENQIQLLGFDISPDLKLEFRNYADCSVAPEAKYDSRSDVFALAKLLQLLVEKSGPEVKKVFKEESDLKALIQQASHESPEKRLPTIGALRGRLDKVRWKDAPKPKSHGVMDAPIQVLTVKDKDLSTQVWESYRPYFLLALAGFLLFVALLVNFAPSAE